MRGGVNFRLWAPLVRAVNLKLAGQDQTLAMEARPDGFFELFVAEAGHGTRYGFELEDGQVVPDPASRFQPDDVHGLSQVIDPNRFAWSDTGWGGRAWEETVLYELHIGTFTPEGTFRAAIEKLDHLVSLGVTAIEIMPVADFPGRWNWGYDGAMLYAPDSSYGEPDDLRALVDAAHARSLSVFLDVVYNHFGPSGNYIPAYAPLFSDKHKTPWGAAVNYDDEGSAAVRDFVIGNTCYWVREFHIDGFRFDAVHEIRDSGPQHLLEELAEVVRAASPEKPVHLVLENSVNQSRWLRRQENGDPLHHTAQWNDDLHHAIHAAATGESFAYYGDFAGRIDLIGRALAEGFAYQGEFLPSAGVARGDRSGFLPPSAFVSFIQNHDQAGNRAFGERLTALVPVNVARALAAVYLLGPQIPMLFMGEEWAASQPFLFFSDIQEFADIIRTSRKQEFREAYDMAADKLVPDPMIEETFIASKIGWDEMGEGEHARFLTLYKDLIRLRHAEIVPRLYGLQGHSGHYRVLGGRGLQVTWSLGDGSELNLLANMSAEPLEDIDCWGGRHLWLEGHASGDTLEGWSVMWSIRERAN